MEPVDVQTYDICVMESLQPVRTIEHVRWPEGDHTHAEQPPTAEDLARQAYAMLNARVG